MAASGAKTSSIASQLGLSRSQTWRILRSEEVQQLIVTLVNEQYGALSALFRRGLLAIEDAYAAERPATLYDQGGPDHYARLAAMKTLGAILTAGRPKLKPPEESARKGLTLAEAEGTENE